MIRGSKGKWLECLMIDELELLKRLKGAFTVASGDRICDDALERVVGDRARDADWIKRNFSIVVEDTLATAYDAYREAERRAGAEAFQTVFGPLLRPHPTREEVFELLRWSFWALDRFFLGLAQGRRPRAGKAFERIIQVLFGNLGYPYTSQAVINGQPDFLLPSEEHFRRHAMDCVIFTVKRTLRERWRQVTTEGTRGYQFFLATIDEDIAARDLPEMLNSRIYIVVPESIRAKCYSAEPNVISFEQFFDQHLDPAMARWRKNGVIR